MIAFRSYFVSMIKSAANNCNFPFKDLFHLKGIEL